MQQTGYSPTPLVKKLGLSEADHLLIINGPKQFLKYISSHNTKVDLNEQDIKKNKEYPYIHYFAYTENELLKIFPLLKQSLKRNGKLWISWPKKTSNIKSNLNENIIRQIGLDHGLVDIKVIAIDENWSGLKFVYRIKDRT